ncbi:MAG: hypothetical protein AB7O21_04225 [Gammaproteobacteria bacterium]
MPLLPPRSPMLGSLLLLWLLVCTGCGQKGELYLPDQAHVEKYSGR